MNDFFTIVTTVAGLAATGLILGYRPLPILAGVVVAVAVPALLCALFKRNPSGMNFAKFRNESFPSRTGRKRKKRTGA